MHQKQPVFVYRLIAEKVLQINVIWRKFQGLFVPWIAENHRKSCIFQTSLVFSRCYEFSTNTNTACWKVTEDIYLWMSWVEFFLEFTNLCFCEFVVDRKKQIIFNDKSEKNTVSFLYGCLFTTFILILYYFSVLELISRYFRMLPGAAQNWSSRI